ncbi:MAG: MarR family transcriptional regulator [Planctomycetota bacterium]
MNTPSLQHELKKKQPFECASQEAYLNLIRTAGELSGPMHALFKSHGLSESTYNVLRILRGAAKTEEAKGLPCLEVADRLVTRVPDITRLVDRLIKAGLAQRCRGDIDRRVVVVSITDAGQALLSKLDRPVRKLHEQQFAHLTGKDVKDLNRLLEKARTPPGE